MSTPVLAGLGVLVTRPVADGALRGALEALGATVHELPATRIDPCDPAALRAALRELPETDWLVFTSQNAVRLFFATLEEMGLDARALGAHRIAAVGSATATALDTLGVMVDVVPERFVAEGVLEALRSRCDVAGARVLYATAEGARPVIADGLRALGADVRAVPFYRSVTDHSQRELMRALIRSQAVSLATFTSSSTVQGYVELAGAELATRVPAVTIGPVTSLAAREAGIDVAGEARESTVDGLVAAIVEWARSRAA